MTCNGNHSESTTADLTHGSTSFVIPSSPIELGENLAFSSLDPPVFDDDNCCGVMQLVDLWIDEGLLYDYGTFPGPGDPGPTEFCAIGPLGCAHFTQVWYYFTFIK